VPLSALPVQDRIPEAGQERLDVFVPPQVMDGGGHIMQAGRQRVEVGAQGSDRGGVGKRRPAYSAPQVPTRRWSPRKHDPVDRLSHPVDRVPAVGHIRHREPCNLHPKDHSLRTQSGCGVDYARWTRAGGRGDAVGGDRGDSGVERLDVEPRLQLHRDADVRGQRSGRNVGA
jgi:hypothetical protein